MEPPEENFEQLKKLLKLKRHETPPPGYFEDFSSNLIARIEAEDARPAPAGWRRFFAGLDTSPIMVGAYGVIVASLVIVGVQMAGRAGSPDDITSDPSFAGTKPGASMGLAASPESIQPAAETDAMIVVGPRPGMIGAGEELARTSPTGMFNPPSIYGGTSSPQRVSFPVER